MLHQHLRRRSSPFFFSRLGKEHTSESCYRVGDANIPWKQQSTVRARYARRTELTGFVPSELHGLRHVRLRCQLSVARSQVEC